MSTSEYNGDRAAVQHSNGIVKLQALHAKYEKEMTKLGKAGLVDDSFILDLETDLYK